MSRVTSNLNSAFLLSAAAALAACGGGGSGGGSSAATADPVAISSANAAEVAGAAYSAPASLEGAGLGGAGVLTGAVTQVSDDGVDMVQVIIDQLKSSKALFAANPGAFVTGASITASEDCTNGGNFSFTLNDADDNQDLSSGDSLSATFNNCIEGTTRMNGTLSINNIQITGDPLTFPYSLQMTLQANNFSVTESGETSSLNGAMTLSQSTGDGVSFVNSVSGTSISLTESGGAATLSAYRLDGTENGSSYTFDINATVSSPDIGGAVTIVTDVTFMGTEPGDPYTGEATITGAGNSSVTLVVLNEVNVQLLVDEDGDGATDTTIDTTWDSL
jgi:hypothetical protein